MLASSDIRAVVCPNPFSMRKIEGVIEKGTSITDAINLYAPRGIEFNANVYINDEFIPREKWNYAYPSYGDLVVIRVIPSGDEGGKNVLRGVLTLAVIATSMWAPGAIGLGKWMGTFVGAGAGILGVNIINRLIPLPQPPESESEPAVYSVTGTDNRANLYGVIPKVYGTMKLYPPLAARQYTEIVNNDQYVRMLFCVGYGELLLSDFKIGDTPIENYADVEYDYCTGSSIDNDTPALYSNDIREESLNSELIYNNWVQRTTDDNADEISVDFTFPAGLVNYDSQGNRGDRSVSIDVQYRQSDQRYLLYDGQTVNFLVGETLIGGTSGAEAKILADTDWGTSGVLRIWQISKTFQNNETITDSQDTPGTAIVNGTMGETYLKYENETGTFTVGNTLTGVTSGVMGAIRGLQDDGVTGKMIIDNATGIYLDDEEIGDGVATADMDDNSETAPWLPNSDATIENLCPGFGNWTTVGASYSGGEITLNNYGSYVESPYIRVNFSTSFTFKASYYSTNASPKYNPDAGLLIETRYYGWGPGTTPMPRQNDNEESVSRYSTSYTTGAWIGKSYDGTGGSRVRWIKIRIKSESPYTASSYKIKSPTLVTDKYTTYTAHTSRALRKTMRWSLDSAGQYDVRVRRATSHSSETDIVDDVYWTALRTIIFQDPIQIDANLALVAMRIKASGQLSGSVNQFNCMASSVLPVWDGSTWIDTETSNPAWVCADVLRCSANKKAVEDTRLDKAALLAWSTNCSNNSWNFDAVIDKRFTLFELLKSVTAVGRASFAFNDEGPFSVVEDKPRSTFTQIFTPRNSSNFRGSKTFYEIPHALKIKFIDKDEDYQENELIVYNDEYDADNATRFETLKFFGITNHEHVYKLGRYHLACLQLRPELFTLDTDVEHIVCTRGDLVRVTHDVPSWGSSVGARIIAKSESSGTTTLTVDDSWIMESGKSYKIRIRIASLQFADVNITNVPGASSSVSFVDPIKTIYNAVAAGDLVVFGVQNLESVQCLIQSIKPKQELGATLTLIEYNAACYNADTEEIPDFDSKISFKPDIHRTPPVPIIYQVRSDEYVLYENADGTKSPQILIELLRHSNADIEPDSIHIHYRETDSGQGWIVMPAQDARSIEVYVRPVEDALAYDIRLRYVSEFGRASDWVEISHTVIGKTTPPPDVTTLYLKQSNRLEWTYPDPPNDFRGFHVRYNDDENLVWNEGTVAHDGFVTNTYFDIGTFTGGIQTWMVKAVDTSGNESTNAATLVKNLGDPVSNNVISEVDYKDESFPGKIVDGTIGGGELRADEETSLFYKEDDVAFYNVSGSSLFYGSYYLAMEYTFPFVPDPDDAGSDLWLDYTVTTLRDIMYRVSTPDYTDDFNRASIGADWTEDNGTWVIDANRCKGTGDASEPDYLAWTNTITIGTKTYVYIEVAEGTHAADTDWGVRICNRIVRYKSGAPDKFQIDKGAGLVDCANQPTWADTTVATYWLFEILADETINFYFCRTDGSAPLEPFFVDSTTVDGSNNEFEFYLGDNGTVCLFDNVKMWVPDTDWSIWPGNITSDDDELYEFRIRVFDGYTRGIISELEANLDVADIVEYIEDESIAAAGNDYLTITETYRSVTHVTLTVQDDAGTAISAKCMDKNPGSGNGPEIECYDSGGNRVAGTVDAIVRGY